MITRELIRSRRATLAGTLLAPALLLILVRVLVGGPSPAPASPALSATPDAWLSSPRSAKPALSPKQQAAARWISEKRLTQDHSTVSPMESTAIVIASDPIASPAPVSTLPSTVPALDALASISISAIMGNDEHGMVSIAGAIHRLGDSIAPGWRIHQINGRDRFIVAIAADGTTRTLRLEP